MRISDWSSDVCSSDLVRAELVEAPFFLCGAKEKNSPSTSSGRTELLAGSARTELGIVTSQSPLKSPIKLGGVHHAAYRCRDAKETVEWYERMLGMTYTTAFAEDHVPSTGAYDPYIDRKSTRLNSSH